jgi:hypothetical protein
VKPAPRTVAAVPQVPAPRYTETSTSRTIDVQPVSREIYHPDNLRWARLDEAEATLIPGPPTGPGPEFVDSQTASAALQRRDTAAPPAPSVTEARPAAGKPQSRAKAAKLGLSTGRIAMLLMSIVILAGAILFRRRHMPLQG